MSLWWYSKHYQSGRSLSYRHRWCCNSLDGWSSHITLSIFSEYSPQMSTPVPCYKRQDGWTIGVSMGKRAYIEGECDCVIGSLAATWELERPIIGSTIVGFRPIACINHRGIPGYATLGSFNFSLSMISDLSSTITGDHTCPDMFGDVHSQGRSKSLVPSVELWTWYRHSYPRDGRPYPERWPTPLRMWDGCMLNSNALMC